MALEVIMPKMGMSMVEGTVIKWKKQVGDPVAKGEPIVEISSEKIESEVESPEEGVLLAITVEEGGVVPYGTVLGLVGQPGEKIDVSPAAVNGKATPAAGQVSPAQAEESAVAANPAANAPVLNGKSALKVSPVARKLAEEAGLDLSTVAGTGPQGRITKEDVEQALAARERQAAQAKSSPDPVPAGPEQAPDASAAEGIQRIPVTGMRKVIASRMQESLLNSAQLTLTMKADVTRLLEVRRQASADVEKRFGEKLTVTDFIARAVVLALNEHKRMNSAYVDHHIEIYGHIHLGIAVALEKGLVVPVIRNAERCSLVQLSQAIKSLSTRARENRLDPDEMKGSTFTITNLGAYGVGHFTPVLNPPEAGILGVGAIEDVPLYVGDELKRCSILPLSLTFDHRVLDGAPAAEFLATVKRFLEEPYTLLV